MKIVGLMVVGGGENIYLKKSLNELKRLSDDAIVVGNNTDEKTEKIIKKFGFWFYRDDREWGKFQPQIKTDLLKKAGNLKPDWIIAIDSDEVFDEKFIREEAEKLASKGGIGYYFYIVNLWNDENHYNKVLNFWNIRFYRYAPEYGLEFLKQPLHCGLAPPMVYYYGNYAPFVLKHYGLMNPEVRRQKVERYAKYDPKARYKDRSYYDALKSNYSGAIFNEEELRQKVADEVKDYRHKEVKMANAVKKYVYVRRLKDGQVMDIPAEHLDQTLKRGGFEYVSEVNFDLERRQIKVPIVEEKETEPKIDVKAETSNPTTCPICGKTFKNKGGLNFHKKTHK